MPNKRTKIFQYICLLTGFCLGYDSTAPVEIFTHCCWDSCTTYGGSVTCYGQFDVLCPAMYGCGYTGSAISGACSGNSLVSQSVDEKHYRISEVTAYNNDNGGVGTG